MTSTFKRSLIAMFENESRLALKSGKKKAIIDFLSTMPDCLQKAATSNNIMHGFLSNGIVDKATTRFPDFEVILATLGQPMKVEEYKLIVDSFPRLCQYVLEHGHIPEELFDKLGFPPDLAMNGIVVRCDAGITCEPQQRAKILSHLIVRLLCQLKFKELEDAASEKLILVSAAIADLLIENEKCEKELFLALGQNIDSYSDVQNDRLFLLETQLEHFATKKCMLALLKAFCHVRTYAGSKAQGQWPKRGTKKNARDGEDVLIKRAFDLRETSIKLIAPPTSEI